MSPPFVIFALPRSRTAWLSKFLTYGDWTCGHEEARHARTVDDLKSWLSLPNTGTVETAAAPFWRTLRKLRPDARVVVVRRPVSEVMDSLSGLGIPFDHAAMERVLKAQDTKLAQIAKRWPSALEVAYSDLKSEETCKAIFEHCLPFAHDHAWWAAWEKANVQVSVPHFVRYFVAFKPQMDKFVSILRHQEIAVLTAKRAATPNGFTLHIDSFDAFLRDADHLLKDHLVAVGEPPENIQAKNVPLMRALDAAGNLQIVTARSNGRVFGYLMTVLSPSLHSRTLQSAIQTTFYASPDAPGLGLKIQRYSLQKLREAGRIDEVFLFAGERGSGPEISALFKRVGAKRDGELYRLNIKETQCPA